MAVQPTAAPCEKRGEGHQINARHGPVGLDHGRGGLRACRGRPCIRAPWLRAGEGGATISLAQLQDPIFLPGFGLSVAVCSCSWAAPRPRPAAGATYVTDGIQTTRLVTRAQADTVVHVVDVRADHVPQTYHCWHQVCIHAAHVPRAIARPATRTAARPRRRTRAASVQAARADSSVQRVRKQVLTREVSQLQAVQL